MQVSCKESLNKTDPVSAALKSLHMHEEFYLKVFSGYKGNLRKTIVKKIYGFSEVSFFFFLGLEVAASANLLEFQKRQTFVVWPK